MKNFGYFYIALFIQISVFFIDQTKCETSNSLEIFPNTINDLCIDLFSEDFKTQPLKSAIPFSIESEVVDTINDEVVLKLTIKTRPSFPYFKLRAFMIRAEVDKYGNKEEIVGKFDSSLNQNAQASSIFFQKCFPKNYESPNLAYRNDGFNNLTDYSFVLHWTGPNKNDLQFRMTLVQDADNYWINVIHKIDSYQLMPYFDPATSYEAVYSHLENRFNTLGCGSTKSCIFWPKYRRTITNSYAYLAFKKYNKYISYELAVYLPDPDANQYAKLSFIDLDESKTHVIKDYNSFTIFCGVNGNGESSLQAGYYDKNDYKRLPIVTNNLVKNVRVIKVTEDGKTYLFCKFFLKAQIDVNTEYADQYRYDLDGKSYRIAINRGDYYENTSIALRTKSYPFTTNGKIKASEYAIYNGTAFNLSIQLHIIFELVAWMILNQVALFVNCYFQYGKYTVKNNTPESSPQFFIWYHILTFLVLLLSWGGIVLMFYHYDEYKLMLSDKHAVFGMVTLALNVIQCIYIIVNLFMKNKVNSGIHKFSVFIGWLGTIFSIVTMFTAAYLPQINDALRWSFLTILIFYTVFEFLKLVVFQVSASSRKRYILVKHDTRKIFRNPDAPGYLLLYISVIELIACVVSFSYFLIMY